MPEFIASRLKVERANKHVTEINEIIVRFMASDFYVVSVDTNLGERVTTNRLEVRQVKPFPKEDIAIVIGEMIHNLRSALDILWWETMLLCKGIPTRWTSFPILDTREGVENKVMQALEKKQISPDVKRVVLETVKPCKAGNPLLWALDDLNIRDKHQLLIPVIELVRIKEVRFKDEEGSMLAMNVDLPVDPVFWLNWENKTMQVEHEGHPALSIRFEQGIPFGGESVIPSLNRIAEEVTRTVEAFEILFS